MSESDSAWPLLIPIGVLMIVFIGTGVPFGLIPVFILVCAMAGGLSEERKIRSARQEMDLWEKPAPGSIPRVPCLILRSLRESPYSRERSGRRKA